MSKKSLDRLSGFKRLEDQQKKDQETLKIPSPEAQTSNTNIQTNKHVNIQTEEVEKRLNELRRQTYYITELQIKALDFYTTFEGKDKSEMVRKILSEAIPEKYISMAKDILDKKYL